MEKLVRTEFRAERLFMGTIARGKASRTISSLKQARNQSPPASAPVDPGARSPSHCVSPYFIGEEVYSCRCLGSSALKSWHPAPPKMASPIRVTRIFMAGCILRRPVLPCQEPRQLEFLDRGEVDHVLDPLDDHRGSRGERSVRKRGHDGADSSITGQDVNVRTFASNLFHIQSLIQRGRQYPMSSLNIEVASARSR